MRPIHLPFLLLFACSSHPAAPGGAAERGAPPAVAPAVVAPSPGVAVAAAPRLGPIDLTAASLDLAALFPRDRVDRGHDTSLVHRAGFSGASGDIIAIVDHDGGRVTRIEVMAPELATATGLAPGDSVARARALWPDAECHWGGSNYAMVCTSPQVAQLTIVLGNEPWGDAATLPLAGAPADVTIEAIVWHAVDPDAMTLAAGPKGAQPPASEVDRCAGLLVLTAICGLARDPDGGFIRTKASDVSFAQAQRRCATTEPDPATGAPRRAMPVFDEPTVRRLAAAAERGCPAFEQALTDHTGGWIVEP